MIVAGRAPELKIECISSNQESWKWDGIENRCESVPHRSPWCEDVAKSRHPFWVSSTNVRAYTSTLNSAVVKKEPPFGRQEYKFDRKSDGENLWRGTHATASRLENAQWIRNIRCLMKRKGSQTSVMGATYQQNEYNKGKQETFCEIWKQEISSGLSVKLQKGNRKKR